MYLYVVSTDDHGAIKAAKAMLEIGSKSVLEEFSSFERGVESLCRHPSCMRLWLFQVSTHRNCFVVQNKGSFDDFER